jgi:hypothetical protein
MDNNRIGSKCWYRTRHAIRVTPWKRGTLRMWGTDHEEFENGPGQYPIGVVEDDETKGCCSVHVERISFADDKPQD